MQLTGTEPKDVIPKGGDAASKRNVDALEVARKVVGIADFVVILVVIEGRMVAALELPLNSEHPNARGPADDNGERCDDQKGQRQESEECRAPERRHDEAR